MFVYTDKQKYTVLSGILYPTLYEGKKRIDSIHHAKKETKSDWKFGYFSTWENTYMEQGRNKFTKRDQRISVLLI